MTDVQGEPDIDFDFDFDTTDTSFDSLTSITQAMDMLPMLLHDPAVTFS